MSAKNLPPCGLYRTTTDIGDVAADTLVYFHNHGDPGPGVYLAKSWTLNRAVFHKRGYTLPEPVEQVAATLEQLPAEGFYRVSERFYCCDEKCRAFEPEDFVQLGYNGDAEAILFVPELRPEGFAIPSVGSVIAPEHLAKLVALRVAEPEETSEKEAASGELH